MSCLTPLDILAIGIVHRFKTQASGNVHLRTLQCTRFESLTLKMQVKDVTDCAENLRLTYFVDVHLCVQIGAFLFCSQ